MTDSGPENANPVTAMGDGIIRIAQLSDCHFHADPEQTYRGMNPYDNLQNLLMTVSDRKPDLVLATGDLSEDGSAASYAALQRFFASLGVPVLALPGNHDDAVLLDKYFPGSPVDSVEVTAHGVWRVIRLNSCIADRHDGMLADRVLADLEQQLACSTVRPVLVALHHQPVPAGSPWIDKYALLEAEKFLGLIHRYKGVRAVVWGHIHQVFETTQNGKTMLGCPSSVVNSLKRVEKFTVDPAGPACRWLNLAPDGKLGTEILRTRAEAATI